MSPEEILELIAIATKLAGVIQKEVSASDSEQVQEAWDAAQNMFNDGYNAAYPKEVVKRG